MTGLIGWWPLHENTGSTARDLSGNGNHGTLSGGVTQGVAGKAGLTAYGFEGSDDGVDLPSSLSDNLDVTGNKAYTISGWTKADDLSNDNRIIQFQNQALSEVHINKNGNLQFKIYDGTSNQATEFTGTSSKTWYHFSAVFNPESGMELWVNGNLVDTNSFSGLADSRSSSSSIGYRSANNDLYYQGKVVDVRAYQRPLYSGNPDSV